MGLFGSTGFHWILLLDFQGFPIPGNSKNGVCQHTIVRMRRADTLRAIISLRAIIITQSTEILIKIYFFVNIFLFFI